MTTSKPENIEPPAILSPADVEELLELSDEKLIAIREEQEALRKRFNSRAKLSRQEYARARGAELEQTYRQSGNVDALAESMAMQGRYQLAAQTAARSDLKREFISKHVAVIQSDDDCACDNFRIENGYKLPNQFVESYGWSEKHGRQMPFIRCTVCDNLNAKEMPDYLNTQRELRAQSLQGQNITAEVFKVR